LRVEQIPQRIWEPAAGRGAIVRVLRDAGHTVIASDLIDYGFPLHTVGDFLKTTAMPAGCEAILTNPPFRWAEEFVAHALKLSPLVIMLLRLAFLESERRCGILEGRGLARIHVFRKRLPMMHRDQWAGNKANSGMVSLGTSSTAITMSRRPSIGSRGNGRNHRRLSLASAAGQKEVKEKVPTAH
jgi:hypothetical protein